MASTRKEIRLWEAGRLHVIGDAADWEEVVVTVDVYLDATGVDPAWLHIPRMSATQSMGRLPPNPREACHPVHRKAATQST